MSLLEVDSLSVFFETNTARTTAVRDLNFSLQPGVSLGIVGESGSGKSQAVLAILGLLAGNGYCQGSAVFDGEQLIGATETQLNRLRGASIAMIFQDALGALNPYLPIEIQMTEVLTQHKKLGRRVAKIEAISLLEAVGIDSAEQRIKAYPHEFSGGMRQRVTIAMALLCRPKLIIADEPTTALDVTVQRQVIDLLKQIQKDFGMAMIFISHDLAVVSQVCDELMVLYAGRRMEQGPTQHLLKAPSHPYLKALLGSMPDMHLAPGERLQTIPGNPPEVGHLSSACPFAQRCSEVMALCYQQFPESRDLDVDHCVSCHRVEQPMGSTSNF